MPFNSSFVSNRTKGDTKSQISTKREAKEVNGRVNLTLQKLDQPCTRNVHQS